MVGLYKDETWGFNQFLQKFWVSSRYILSCYCLSFDTTNYIFLYHFFAPNNCRKNIQRICFFGADSQQLFYGILSRINKISINMSKARFMTFFMPQLFCWLFLDFYIVCKDDTDMTNSKQDNLQMTEFEESNLWLNLLLNFSWVASLGHRA